MAELKKTTSKRATRTPRKTEPVTDTTTTQEKVAKKRVAPKRVAPKKIETKSRVADTRKSVDSVASIIENPDKFIDIFIGQGVDNQEFSYKHSSKELEKYGIRKRQTSNGELVFVNDVTNKNLDKTFKNLALTSDERIKQFVADNKNSLQMNFTIIKHASLHKWNQELGEQGLELVEIEFWVKLNPQSLYRQRKLSIVFLASL